MVAIVYDILLLAMLLILYYCGKNIAKTGKVFSIAGIIAIATFTLNEGLRFGRGIDYNVYGMRFERYIGGGIIENDELLYASLIRLFINVGIPYQILIVIQSFMYIVGLLYFLRNYREILPLALPIFVCFSLMAFENYIRWYMGFSLILLAVATLVNGKSIYYYIALSIMGLMFHFGLFPIPILIFIIFKIKKIIVKPYITILVYIFVGLFVKSDIMMYLAGYMQYLSIVYEHTNAYIGNAEKWLTSGALGLVGNSFDGIHIIVYVSVVVWLGYYYIKKLCSKYIFVYNLFVIGLMLKPLANQVELLQRYVYLFYYFGAVVTAIILFGYRIKVFEKIKYRFLGLVIIIVFQLNYFIRPFVFSQNNYLYVWDQENKTYSSMHILCIKEATKNN